VQPSFVGLTEDKHMRGVMTLKATVNENGRITGREDDRDGVFHCWGAEAEDGENNWGNFTVAIVEFADGKVGTFRPDYIRFIDR
jgi:subtilisin-like proprotein convertase family protein